MKKLLLIIPFFLCEATSAQTCIPFSVHGSVLGCTDQKPVKNIEVKLTCANGSVIKTKTDGDGKYRIDSCFRETELVCYLRCAIPLFGNCIMNNSPSIKRKLILSSTNPSPKTEDFCIEASEYFNIDGKVFDCKTKGPISNAIVKLVGNDGQSIETKTDSSGSYAIKTSSQKEKFLCVISVLAGENPHLNSAEKIKLDFSDSSKTNSRVADFCLTKHCGCNMMFPVPRFNKNTFFDPNYDYPGDELGVAVGMLESNPNIVIELGGHATQDEKKPFVLGKKRAQFYYDQLVKKGIDPTRLSIKSYGDTVQSTYIDDSCDWIKYEKNDPKNRRVSTKIIRKDFKPVRKEE